MQNPSDSTEIAEPEENGQSNTADLPVVDDPTLDSDLDSTTASTVVAEVLPGTAVVFGEVPAELKLDLIDFGLVSAADRAHISAVLASIGNTATVSGTLANAFASVQGLYRVSDATQALVGRAVSWAQSALRLSPALAAVLTAPPSDATPLVLPYLTGERAPGWVGGARAVLSGVSAATDADTIFRGIVEGVAMTYARVADELQPAAPQVVEVAAVGRISNDQPEWLQILADVLGRPVTHVTRRRATQRGTALLALDVLAPDVPRAPRATGATFEPRPGHVEHYAGRRTQFAEVYDALVRG
jgi:sugar (pentulose or hexulose) kinase